MTSRFCCLRERVRERGMFSGAAPKSFHPSGTLSLRSVSIRVRCSATKRAITRHADINTNTAVTFIFSQTRTRKRKRKSKQENKEKEKKNKDEEDKQQQQEGRKKEGEEDEGDLVSLCTTKRSLSFEDGGACEGEPEQDRMERGGDDEVDTAPHHHFQEDKRRRPNL